MEELTRVCTRCARTHPLAQFPADPRRRGGRASHCRGCTAERVKAWKRANPAAVRRDKRAYRERIASLLAVAKDQPCARCGERYPACVMDFHHRDPATKLFAIGQRTGAKGPLVAEIAKCDVLCANCHRIVEADLRERPIHSSKENTCSPSPASSRSS